jgi:hypothetical protein
MLPKIITIMEEKKNTLPSVDEAKLRIELYNDLCTDLKGMKRDEVRKILNELDSYVKKMNCLSRMDLTLYLRYVMATQSVYHYLYKTKQLEREGGFTAETLKAIEDVFITIYKDYDESRVNRRHDCQ